MLGRHRRLPEAVALKLPEKAQRGAARREVVVHERALAVGQRDAELPRADAEVDVLEGGLAELRVEVERRGGGAGRGGGSGGGGLAARRLRRRRRAQRQREVARAAVQQRPVGQHAPVERPGAVVELVDQTGLGLSVRGRGGGDELGGGRPRRGPGRGRGRGERLGLGAVGLGAPADDPATRRVLLLREKRLEPGRGRGAVGVGERDNGGARGRSGVEAGVPRRGGAGVCGVAQQAVGQLFFFFFLSFFGEFSGKFELGTVREEEQRERDDDDGLPEEEGRPEEGEKGERPKEEEEKERSQLNLSAASKAPKISGLSDALASPAARRPCFSLLSLSEPPIFLPHLRVQPRQRSHRAVVDDDQRLGRPRLPREGRDAVGEASPLGVGAGEGRDDDDEDFAVRGGGAEELGHGVGGDSVGRGSERVRGGGMSVSGEEGENSFFHSR